MGGPPQDPMQRMRRPVEFEGDRVSHWMAGDHCEWDIFSFRSYQY